MIPMAVRASVVAACCAGNRGNIRHLEGEAVGVSRLRRELLGLRDVVGVPTVEDLSYPELCVLKSCAVLVPAP